MGRFDKRHPGANKYVRILKNDPCVWCGGEGGTIEHVTPRSKLRIMEASQEGMGRDNWQNLSSSCSECNRKRDDKEMLMFLIERQNEGATLRGSDFVIYDSDDSGV